MSRIIGTWSKGTRAQSARARTSTARPTAGPARLGRDAGARARAAGGALALGLAPHLAANAERAAERFTDRSAQVEVVLGDKAPTPPAAPAPLPAPTLSMVIVGGLAAAGAVAIAALSLWRDRLPAALVRAIRTVGHPPLAALRRLHSGHVGDYVTWVTFGTAVLGGLLALAARPG